MKRKVRVAALVGLLIALTSAAWAERRSIHFDRYTLDQGLSQSAINAIAQDGAGFMWFGTQEGLNRFDGFEFTVFSQQAGDPTSISNSWIWALLVDSESRLWVGTDGGLNRWNPSTQDFTRYVFDSSNPTTLSNNIVRTVFEDSSGQIWVGTDGGLNLLIDEDQGAFQRYAHNESYEGSLSADAVRAIFEDSQGTLWVGTRGGGLNRFDAEPHRFEQFRHDPEDPNSLSHDDVRSIYEDQLGNLWIGTEGGGLNRFDRESGTFDRVPGKSPGLDIKDVRWIHEDNSGDLWIGTTSGLAEWLPDRDDFRTYTHDPTDPSSLSDDTVMSIFQDRGGVLWVGTRVGLNKWNPTTSTFGAFTASDPEGERLSGNAVYSFAEGADGDIWVGTFGAGLNRIDHETGRVTHYREDPDDPGGLGDDKTPTLYVDSRGDLWIGTFTAGLFRYDESRDSFINYRHDPEDPASLSGNAVTSIYEDGEGVFWIGTFDGGLNRFDPRTGNFFDYRNLPQNETSLSSDKVLVIEEDSLGVLWIGTFDGGLSGLDRQTGIFTRVKSASMPSEEVMAKSIWSLHEDRDGSLWVGTDDSGLFRWSLEDRRNHRAQFDRYTQKQGLPNNDINGILEDEDGHLWLSTNQGLSRFNPRTNEFRNLKRSNGLLSNEFNQGAHLRTRSGKMFFGGANGVNFFNPREVLPNPHSPPVVLTSLLQNNQPGEFDRPLADIEQIELQHTDYVVSFEFAALDFTSPEDNEYAYKLVPFDEDWVHTRDHRFANYTNLDPGDYTFRVKAANNDGLWNEEGLSVAIKVASPPWQTWWAYTLYAASFASALFAYARMQGQKLEKEAEYSRKLEREVQTRTRELAERNSELEQANNKLQQASFTDSLTGLRNRRYLMSTISEDIALVDRYYRDLSAGSEPPNGKRPDFLFLIFDLDGFKEVNDTFGHAAGDRVLVQVRDILEKACRSSDTVIRWGGDEFLIVGRYADRRAAEILSDRIRSSVDQHPFQLGNDVEARLSCSIGFAYYPFAKAAPTLMNWEQVVAIADRALYIAKNSGRNAWVGVQDTPTTCDLSPEALVQQINDRIDRLVADGYLALHSSIDDEQELVWAWG
jgi:diguanylate cyclase (GGDEF)-like protein